MRHHRITATHIGAVAIAAYANGCWYAIAAMIALPMTATLVCGVGVFVASIEVGSAFMEAHPIHEETKHVQDKAPSP